MAISYTLVADIFYFVYSLSHRITILKIMKLYSKEFKMVAINVKKKKKKMQE